VLAIRLSTPERFPRWKDGDFGWRLVNSSWENNYRLGEQQFDSLLNMDGSIDPRFLVTGLEVLSELGKPEKIISVLKKQDERTLEEICSKELFTQKLTNIEICKSRFKEEHVTNGQQSDKIFGSIRGYNKI
jgi:hypothetical protein